jgi:parvulin-like peptidyl-prolyl isomerase
MRNPLKRVSLAPGASRRAIIGWVAALGVGLALSTALTGCAPAANSDPVVAMRIDGAPVSLSSYQQELALLTASNALQTDANASAVGWMSPDDRSMIASGRQQTVQFFITLQTLKKLFNDQKLTVSQSDIDVAQKSLDSAVASARDQLKQTSGNERLRQEVEAATPEAVHLLAEENAYENVFLDKGSAPTAHMRYIAVSSQADADSIIKQLQAGADFATLAKANSLDTQTGANGGVIPTQIYAGQLGSDFDQKVFGATQYQGYFSEPLSSGFGVFQVVGKTSMTKLSAVGDLSTEQQYFDSWLSGTLIKQATVENYVGA